MLFISIILRNFAAVKTLKNKIMKKLLTTTFVGSDVTTSKPQGAVSIDKGKLTNKSQGDMIIKNNFEVKLGAELEITN